MSNTTHIYALFTLSLHERSSDLDWRHGGGLPVGRAGDDEPDERLHVPRSRRARACRPSVAELAGKPVQQFGMARRSEEHTSELQSRRDIVCRLLLGKKYCTIYCE